MTRRYTAILTPAAIAAAAALGLTACDDVDYGDQVEDNAEMQAEQLEERGDRIEEWSDERADEIEERGDEFEDNYDDRDDALNTPPID